MANTLTIQILVRSTGTFKFNSPQESFSITTAGDHHSYPGQTIGITPEALEFSADIGNKGGCYIKNTSTTNSVDIGLMVGSTFYPLLTIGPERVAFFEWHPDATPYAQASATSGTLVENLTFEA